MLFCMSAYSDTNQIQSIIKMHQNGVDSLVISNYIQKTDIINITPEEIIQLTKFKIDNSIINLLITKSAEPKPQKITLDEYKFEQMKELRRKYLFSKFLTKKL